MRKDFSEKFPPTDCFPADEKLKFMKVALSLAKKAFSEGEIPVGAAIVKDGKIVSRAYNKREKNQNALYHAEILAIDKACKKLKSWRLDDCFMFVTVEPCVMCAGAIANARIKKLYFGAEQLKDGAVKNAFGVFDSGTLNSKVEWEGGLLASECASLMVDFFVSRRKNLPKNN